MKHILGILSIVGLAACGQPPFDPTDTRTPRAQSRIAGELVLYPDGCRLASPRICRIAEPLRFQVPRRDGLTWASKVFEDAASKDGTTDGASIPKAVWSIVGLPYDPLFIRPAILHDHYTYSENLVRPWQETHGMFFYALIEEGVDAVTAQIMFYAVYTFGGHWTEVLVGDDCGPGCAQLTSKDGAKLVYYPPTLDTPEAADDIAAVAAILRSASPQGIAPPTADVLLAQVIDLAERRNPADIPFIAGGPMTISLQTVDDFAADIASGRAVVIDAPVTD